jgi:hypothetical protein
MPVITRSQSKQLYEIRRFNNLNKNDTLQYIPIHIPPNKNQVFKSFQNNITEILLTICYISMCIHILLQIINIRNMRMNK